MTSVTVITLVPFPISLTKAHTAAKRNDIQYQTCILLNQAFILLELFLCLDRACQRRGQARVTTDK